MTRRLSARALPLACTLLLACWVLPACAPAEERGPIAERPVRVVATTSMIADLARQIGGERAEVEGLMGPGVDPHLYRPRESDVARLVGADLVLYNGLDLEGKMGEVFGQVEGRGIAARAVAEAVPAASRLTPSEFEGRPDPHVWMDVSLWKLVAADAADAFAAVDPAHADGYRARLAAYQAELDTLDAFVRARVAELPPERRILVTAHDAFNYFGRAYGVEVRGLQGLSTATEAGAADVRDLAAFVADRGVPALFVESSVPPRSIEAVLAAVRARGGRAEIGGNLYSDALGDAAGGADTYLGMIRHNVDTIVAGLSGGGMRDS